jgi:hypothetical protein
MCKDCFLPYISVFQGKKESETEEQILSLRDRLYRLRGVEKIFEDNGAKSSLRRGGGKGNHAGRFSS